MLAEHAAENSLPEHEDIATVDLGAEVMRLLREGGYTKAAAARLLGVKQGDVTALLNAKFQLFTDAELQGFIDKLQPAE